MSARLIRRHPFGSALSADTYVLDNGLTILVCEDHSAPVVAYHTWFAVGSRHERVGKTGLAHLFEHLMFNETEHHPAGEFDRLLEEAGAESNASTWLDWTEYSISVPKDQLDLVISLESDRMAHLVLREPQVRSEKEVVANERRYRVEDDVEGSVSETLFSTAFNQHSYRWPTIGWMEDIQGFTTEDCREFYETYYAPNNATIVVAGDVNATEIVDKIASAYAQIPAGKLPVEQTAPESEQAEERRVEVKKPTVTEKLVLGYKSPSLGDFDYPALALLSDVLAGGRTSRLYLKLIRELEICSEVRAFVGPFRDPGLFEVFASAREGHTAEQIHQVVDAEIDKLRNEPVLEEEVARVKAHSELALLSSLETVDGKASTLGFYQTVLGRPAAAFERLEALERISAADLLRVARRYLRPDRRSVVVVRTDEDAE
jgi:zinc protease